MLYDSHLPACSPKQHPATGWHVSLTSSIEMIIKIQRCGRSTLKYVCSSAPCRTYQLSFKTLQIFFHSVPHYILHHLFLRWKINNITLKHSEYLCAGTRITQQPFLEECKLYITLCIFVTPVCALTRQPFSFRCHISVMRITVQASFGCIIHGGEHPFLLYCLLNAL